SQRRSQNVMTWLGTHGVEPVRLQSRGFGETRPAAPNETRIGRALNRRVEFLIVDPVSPAIAAAASTNPATANQAAAIQGAPTVSVARSAPGAQTATATAAQPASHPVTTPANTARPAASAAVPARIPPRVTGAAMTPTPTNTPH